MSTTKQSGDTSPAIGISSCLLGEQVRYDGQHKLDHFLRDTLGPFVRWVPVCPEVEMGLSVPRESMRLVGTPQAPRLVTRKSGVDHTEGMLRWAKKKIDVLEDEELCGFVFKSRSPSSGMRSVKVYRRDGVPSGTTAGLFAGAFMERFPLLPVEDDGRMHDPGLRENFIERVFVYRRWLDFAASGGGAGGLVAFHTRHKYMIMAHSPAHLAKLGRIVAGAKSRGLSKARKEYLAELMDGLRLKATVKKNKNVLHHILGYFRKVLTADEKAEVLEVIDEYGRGLVPLVVPVVLLRHFTRRYSEPYLRSQYYLYPHPAELRLRTYL